MEFSCLRMVSSRRRHAFREEIKQNSSFSQIFVFLQDLLQRYMVIYFCASGFFRGVIGKFDLMICWLISENSMDALQWSIFGIKLLASNKNLFEFLINFQETAESSLYRTLIQPKRIREIRGITSRSGLSSLSIFTKNVLIIKNVLFILDGYLGILAPRL